MMDAYFAPFTEGEPDWSRIPIVKMDTRYLDTSEAVTAYAQMCCTENSWFVHQWIECPEVRAQERGPYGVPCEDSCLEFFFCPVSSDARYINIEFNINRCMYLGIGTGLDDLIRLIPDQPNNPLSPITKQTEKGWELYYRIDYRFIKRLFPEFAPFSENVIRGNFYACSECTQPPYYLSWNPIDGDPFTFHRRECFGTVILPNNEKI